MSGSLEQPLTGSKPNLFPAASLPKQCTTQVPVSGNFSQKGSNSSRYSKWDFLVVFLPAAKALVLESLLLAATALVRLLLASFLLVATALVLESFLPVAKAPVRFLLAVHWFG